MLKRISITVSPAVQVALKKASEMTGTSCLEAVRYDSIRESHCAAQRFLIELQGFAMGDEKMKDDFSSQHRGTTLGQVAFGIAECIKNNGSRMTASIYFPGKSDRVISMKIQVFGQNPGKPLASATSSFMDGMLFNLTY